MLRNSLWLALALVLLAPAALAGEGTAALTAAQEPGLSMVRAPVSDTDPLRTPGSIGFGSIDPQGRLRVACRPGTSTPTGPLVSTIATGGVAVVVFAAGSMSNVIDIMNPPSATETLYVDVVATAVAGAPTSFPLEPGRDTGCPARSAPP